MIQWGMQPDQVMIRTNRLLVPLAGLLTTAIFVLGLTVPVGWALDGLYVVPISLVALWSSSRRFFLVVAAATVSTVLSTYIFFNSPFWDDDVLMISTYLIPIGGVWFIAALSLLRKSLEQRVRRLRRLLTICASCKRIRDDRSSWSLEQYVREHSGALLSLGVCSDCAMKLGPE